MAIQNKGSCAIECNEWEFGGYFQYSYSETVSKGATDACTCPCPYISQAVTIRLQTSKRICAHLFIVYLSITIGDSII